MDKRKYARLIARLEVEIKKLPGDDMDKFTPVVSKDISVSGIGLVSDVSFEACDVLKLVIKLPNERTIHAVGMVKWVTERENLYAPTQKDYLVGIEFTQLAHEDRQEIEKFIAEATQ